MKKTMNEDVASRFDTGDADSVGRNVGPTRTGASRQTAPSNPKAPRQNPTSHLPGLPPQRMKREATPFGGRSRTQTTQFQRAPNTPLQATSAPPAKTEPGEQSWDVYVNGGGVYKVPAPDETTAKQRTRDWLNSGGDEQYKGQQFDDSAFQAVKAEGGGATAGGSLMGHQGPGDERDQSYQEALVAAVRLMVREVVRKKAGGGGYVLYSPNRGKKKPSKAVGEFPTRLAAKRAELARFPPKDPEQLKKTRKRIDKLNKDPKKRQAAEKQDLSGREKPKKTGSPARDRKKKTESMVREMSRLISERLFHEEEIPGSPWDEKIASMHPDALASDKKLHGLHRGIEKASIGALGDGHKALSKVLRGVAKVNPGDIAFDPERMKSFMPVMLDVDGTEIGPVHLYIDGGHVKVEVSRDARQAISQLEPRAAHDMRGALLDFEEDHLPRIDGARRAWQDRDTYLDRLHRRLEKHLGGLSGIEQHLAKDLLKGGKKR